MSTRPTLRDDLSSRLAEWDAQGLRRRLRVATAAIGGAGDSVDGRPIINFASNDYLGLASHPALIEAAAAAARDYGAGVGASRLISGNVPLAPALEEALANWKGWPAALTFSTGYAAALGTIPALVGTGDTVVVDKLAHASLIDAARLSGARLRVFPHNDLDYLEKILTSPRSVGRVLVVTESVFSMDGDVAPLREIVALKERHGAWLMVDEAHSTGLFGATGSGLIADLGLTERVEVQMATLGKALGASGGVIGGSRELIDWLINRARSFVFSTGPTPAAFGAALAGVRIASGEEGARLRAALWSRVREFTGEEQPASSIVPIPCGDEQRAVEVSQALDRQGFWVPAIRYPTVPRGQARLRVSLSARHTAEEVQALRTACEVVLPADRVRGR